MVKSLEFVYFLFQSYNKCFRTEMFSVLVESYSISLLRLQHAMQKALFLCFFCVDFFCGKGDVCTQAVLITYLITLSQEKEIIVLEKSLEKS